MKRRPLRWVLSFEGGDAWWHSVADSWHALVYLEEAVMWVRGHA